MKAYFDGGKLNGQELDLNDVLHNGLLEVRGYTLDETEARKRGELTHIKELDNKPQFAGYVGPMWNRYDNSLRYETVERYGELCI